MNKFTGVDLIQSLEAVLHQNTGFYQSDFEIELPVSMMSVKSRN